MKMKGEQTMTRAKIVIVCMVVHRMKISLRAIVVARTFRKMHVN